VDEKWKLHDSCKIQLSTAG